MGCCVAGCFRMLAFALWRAVFAAVLAVVLARIDSYVASSGKTDSMAGRAWRLYRSRSGKKARRADIVDTQGRPTPPSAGTEGPPRT